jgi:tripartite-type tricarboxylate transporter receptor subunit TctC
MNRLAKLTAACIFSISAFAVPALAADYPSEDIRMIVPWGAGGGTDGIVRKLGTIAEKKIGRSIYVENIEGGISATGIIQVMKAQPTGYTLGALTYDSVVTVPWQGLLSSYKLDKLKLIARVTSEPDAMMAATKSPYKTISDLLAAAKKAPGKVKIGIQNTGSRTHLAMLQLQDMAGVQFKLISYPGGAAPQKEAVLSGEVDVVVTSMGDFSSLFESGDVRGLIEFSDGRNLTFPDVPTAKESGFDLQIGSFIVLAAPANTPDDIVAKIEAAYKEALEGDEFQQWVSKIGVTPNWLGTKDVTTWANTTQDTLFGQMKELVKQGILKK